VTRADATPPSSTGKPPRSSPSARAGDRGNKTARPQSPETKHCAPPGIRPGILDALDRVPGRQPDRSKDALLESLRRTHRGKTPNSQTAEIQIRVALINRFNALGTAEIVRVG
jgi:hypothetical protein